MAEYKDIVGENERILQEWEKFNSTQEEKPNFAPDGIMFRGEKDQYSNPDGSITSERYEDEHNKENELWANAPIRYLFVTKDQNAWGGSAWDVRGETARYELDSNSIPLRFYRNFLYLLYGLSHTSGDAMCGYDDFSNAQAIETFDSIPLARINVKKQAGTKSISNAILAKYMERDKDFIVRQIKNLDADIIICCGYSEYADKSGNLILNFLNENLYNFQKVVEDWIYYDKVSNKVAINAWHLSHLAVKEKDFFEGMISAYHEFLKVHPTFTESHRINK